MSTIWDHTTKPILILSPQAGITDSAFRQIARQCGADIVYTEFASCDGLVYNPKPSLERLKFDASEHPVVCQIFGNNPEYFFKATQLIERAGFDGVDINFGCPAKKVVGNNGGVCLMRDLTLVRQIVEATCNAVRNIPVSIKIRRSIGLRDEHNHPTNEQHTALDLINAIHGLPVKALIIHGRSYEKPFNGDPDFDMIRRVKEQFDGIVIGNGGVNTPEDAKAMLDKTGADGVAIARGVYGNPWIFQQINEYLATGRYSAPTPEQKQETALQHADLMHQLKGERGIIEMRKHLAWYFKGWDGASKFRSQLANVKTPDDVRQIVRSIQLTENISSLDLSTQSQPALAQ